MSTAIPLRPIEIAAGFPLGLDAKDSGGSAPSTPPHNSARAALQSEVTLALARPPCVVALSGGRHSSAMLAVAVTVARREGLPEPIALSWRFPDVPKLDEFRWQEQVVRHLKVQHWERTDIHDEFDILGAVATRGLLRHGLLWPPNAHLDIPTLDCAGDGTVLSTYDGRLMLDTWRWARVNAVLHGRARPRPRDLRGLALALAPPPVRRRVQCRRMPPQFRWLRPEARTAAVDYTPAGPLQPRRWDRRTRWAACRREVRVTRHSAALLAADRGAAIRHPLVAPAVVDALAREGGAEGFGNGLALLRAVYGDLLPGELLARRPTTAEYGPVLWGPAARTFAERWDGTGIDTQLVDPDQLRRIWAGAPASGAATLAQSAWLAQQPR